MEIWIWTGIIICITQSATMSGLNIALFSLSRLRLEVAAENGDDLARRVMELRQDSNYTLATILWGNVSINVLLTLLVDSVLIGVSSFLFSTLAITIVGEIFPQAYFTRHALRVGAALAPVLKFYKIVLFPISKPTGMLLDKVVGEEAIPWFRENELRNVLEHHARESETELSSAEATGAINFLDIDDRPLKKEGELINPLSIIELPFDNGKPVFPVFQRNTEDAFLQRISSSGKKWIVLKNQSSKKPQMVLNAPHFLRKALFGKDDFEPMSSCHQPMIVTDPHSRLGNVLHKLKVEKEKPGDDVIDKDLILYWTDNEQRIITGSDILGYLMRRIAKVV
jgi:metal transporter CNNM